MTETATKPTRPAIALATLIEQTARGIYDQRGPANLHPVQWAALRFFARANRRARSVAGLAQYMDGTLGPASRTVSALKKHELIETAKDPTDARVSIVSLTDKGRAALDADPIQRLASALDSLSQEEFAQMASALTDVNALMSKAED